MKKVALWILVVLVILGLGGYLGMGYMIYDQLSLISPVPDRFENTPADYEVIYNDVTAVLGGRFDTSPYLMPTYEEVSFPSRDANLTLAGWYIPGDPGAPAVIVTHGINAGKSAGNALTVAGLLHKSGFNVLMFDLRNHGESSKDDGRTSIGTKEYKDVLGAWDYMVTTRGFSPERVGLYGMSLGGASTLNAYALEPRVAAAMVDSPFSNLQQIVAEELARNKYPSFLAPACILSARLFQGVNLVEHSPKDAIHNAAGRPLFIVHGTADQRVNVHHTQDLMALAEELGVPVAVWYVDGADHVSAMFLHPEEYREKMTNFYLSALGGD